MFGSQNKQRTHIIQQQKEKRKLKIAKDLSRHLSKKIYTNGQEAYEKMFTGH